MTQPIVFYDIPSKAWSGQTWSPNLWKGRIALNMKGVPYKTVWIEYPDIADLCKRIGAEPTGARNGAPVYTLPVIQDPSTGAVLSDSYRIAKYLDETYPAETNLIPPRTDALQKMFADLWTPLVQEHMRNADINKILSILNPHSEEYWRRTRTEMFGKPIDEVAPEGPASEEHWRRVLDGLSRVSGWMDANEPGKTFFTSDTPSWADVVLASSLAALRASRGGDSERWKQVMAANEGRWARFTASSKTQKVTCVPPPWLSPRGGSTSPSAFCAFEITRYSRGTATEVGNLQRYSRKYMARNNLGDRVGFP